MRLIDADAYAAEMRKRQEYCRAWKDSLDRGSETYARAEQSFITFVEAALTLKNQPTIDAIPVEWIHKFCEDDISEEQREAIEWMLGVWQREQEAR